MMTREDVLRLWGEDYDRLPEPYPHYEPEPEDTDWDLRPCASCGEIHINCDCLTVTVAPNLGPFAWPYTTITQTQNN